jgi:hypothetical protein
LYYLKRRKAAREAAERPAKKRFGGAVMTFFSLALTGVFIAVFKAKNPEMSIKPIVTMFGAVALGCAAMTLVSRKRKNDD